MKQYTSFNIPRCLGTDDRISWTYFRNEFSHFTAMNCYKGLIGIHSPSSTTPAHGFILASDVTTYTSCYTRPAIGIISNIIQAPDVMNIISDPWVVQGSSVLTIAFSHETLTDLDLTKLISSA